MSSNPNVIVSFRDYDLPPRYDGQQWVQLQIEESSDPISGPWTLIDTQNIDPTINPAHPEPISFTTELATLQAGIGWYRVTFVDSTGDTEITEPVFNAGPIEILCTIDDVNSHFDRDVLTADAENTQLPQVDVARLIKGYLARILDPVALASWSSPDKTPDIIRECAGFLVASQVYINYAMRTTIILDQRNIGQWLYDQGMGILNGVLAGQIPILDPITDEPVPVQNPETMEDGLDYFPIDDTDRAFTMSQKF